MIGSCIAFNPCCKCDEKGMCNICELTYRRNGQLADSADIALVRHGYWLSAYEYSLRFDISEKRRNEVKNDRRWKFCNLCEQSVKWDYDYCPNCGAKMDVERKEENDKTE